MNGRPFGGIDEGEILKYTLLAMLIVATGCQPEPATSAQPSNGDARIADRDEGRPVTADAAMPGSDLGPEPVDSLVPADAGLIIRDRGMPPVDGGPAADMAPNGDGAPDMGSNIDNCNEDEEGAIRFCPPIDCNVHTGEQIVLQQTCDQQTWGPPCPEPIEVFGDDPQEGFDEDCDGLVDEGRRCNDNGGCWSGDPPMNCNPDSRRCVPE